VSETCGCRLIDSGGRLEKHLGLLLAYCGVCRVRRTQIDGYEGRKHGVDRCCFVNILC